VIEAEANLREYEFKKAADGIMSLADYGNTYFQGHEPWKLIKSDLDAAGSAVRSSLQVAKALIILMQPFMPGVMEKAWGQLGLDGTATAARYSEATVPLEPGHTMGRPKILFKRMEEETVAELEAIFQRRISEAGSREGKRKEEKMETIPYKDFMAIDLRVGEIAAAEGIKGSEKLLKLSVDIGEGKRQIVAGIAKGYSPADLVGTQVIVVANLEPAKLFGVESQGMLLAADVDGKALLLHPEKRVEPGTRVR